MRVKFKTQPMWAFGCSCAEIKVISIQKGKTTKRLGCIRLIKVVVEVTQVDRNWKDVQGRMTLRKFRGCKTFNIR